MKTYNALQVREIISQAVDDADRELWNKMKASNSKEAALVLIAQATALELVNYNLLRLMVDLDE